MDTLCPQCRVALVDVDHGSARCPTTHGAKYRVLFKRTARAGTVASPVAGAAAGGVPPAAVSAAGTPAPTAGMAPPPPFPPGVMGDAAILSTPPPSVAPPSYPGMHCVQHPKVAATAQCKSCGAYMCNTCDFLLPGGTHLCPACATRPETELNPKRKKALIGSSILGVWCTVWMALIFSGAFAGSTMNVNLLGWIFILMVMIPSICGLSWGYGAIDRRRSNPPLLWVATIWNAVILVGFLLLCVVGSFRQ